MLRFRHVSFHYDERRPVLCDVNLALEPGERVALLGANGSGKTTLLHLVVGLLRPTAGTVEAFGKPRRSERDFHEVRCRAGLVFQDPDDQLFCPTVLEDVAFGPMNLGLPRDEVRRVVRQTLARLGLEGYENRITYQLSMGERRQVCLATVLAMNPELLLLDEPTANLDPAALGRLMDFLRDWPHALLLVSHDVEVVRRLCGRAVVLAGGKVVADGPVDEVLAAEQHALGPRPD